MNSATQGPHQHRRVSVRGSLVLVNTVASVLTHVLNVGILVWLQQYLLRRITPEEYSLLPVIMAPVLIVPTLVGVMTAAIGRFVVDAWDRGDDEEVGRIVSSIVPVLVAGSALLFAIMLVLIRWPVEILGVAPQYLADARLMLALLAVGGSLQFAFAPFTIGLFVRQRFVLSSLLTLAAQVVRIALLGYLVIFVSPRVRWLVVANVATDLLLLFVTVHVSRRLVPELRFRLRNLRWKMLPPLFSFGSWNLVQGIALSMRRGLLPISLSHLSTSLEVACFHLGSLVFEQCQMLTTQAVQPTRPSLVAMHSRGDVEGLRAAYLRAGRYALWLAGLMAMPLIVFRRELVVLYVGDAFLGAAAVMLYLLPIMFLQYGNLLLGQLAYAKGFLRPFVLRVVLYQGLCVIFGLVLILQGKGAVGAAQGMLLAAVVTHPLIFLPMGLRTARVSFATWLRATLRPGLLPGIAGGAAWWATREIAHPSSWTALAGCFAAGSVVYAVVLARFSATAAERRAAVRLARGATSWREIARAVQQVDSPGDGKS